MGVCLNGEGGAKFGSAEERCHVLTSRRRFCSIIDAISCCTVCLRQSGRSADVFLLLLADETGNEWAQRIDRTSSTIFVFSVLFLPLLLPWRRFDAEIRPICSK